MEEVKNVGMENVFQLKDSVETQFVLKDSFAQTTDVFHANKNNSINAFPICNAEMEKHVKTENACLTSA